METGKIYWITGEFKHIGLLDVEGEHSIARIENSRVDENMVKIITEPTDFGEGKVSLSINLTRGRGFTYSGKFLI